MPGRGRGAALLKAIEDAKAKQDHLKDDETTLPTKESESSKADIVEEMNRDKSLNFRV